VQIALFPSRACRSIAIRKPHTIARDCFSLIKEKRKWHFDRSAIEVFQNNHWQLTVSNKSASNMKVNALTWRR
jgi:hypothetical protein